MSMFDEMRETRVEQPLVAYLWGVVLMIGIGTMLALVGLGLVALWNVPWLIPLALILFGVPAWVVFYDPKKGEDEQ